MVVHQLVIHYQPVAKLIALLLHSSDILQNSYVTGPEKVKQVLSTQNSYTYLYDSYLLFYVTFCLFVEFLMLKN